MKLKANGIEINYDKQGSGPMVTLSHSLGCDLHMWDEQVTALASQYTVLRFDTRGHGQTSAPEGAYSLDQMSDDLKGLLDGLGITETHFVGLSMGGMIGQTFALRHPSMVKSLVLCDTTSRYPAAAAPFRARRPDVMERVGGMIRNTPPAGYIGCCHAIPAIDVTDRLKELRCPALIIVGEEDPGTPVEMAREIHAALPGSQLAILRSASHLSNVEQPEEFNRTLRGFLDKASGKSAL